jgi:hypothetical protein
MVQAKDIPDEVILERLPSWPGTISGWDLTASLVELGPVPTYPWKVVNAKLRSMKKRGLVNGCPCGCRGDWCRPTAGSL